MARYWVGGTGNWNDTAHWSDTSGGVGGQTVPSSSDDVYFDLHSNESTDAAYTCSINVSADCLSLDVSFTGTTKVTISGTSPLNVYGNFNLSGGSEQVIYDHQGGTFFKSTSSVNINFNGVSINSNDYITFNGIGGTFTLNSNIILSNTRDVTITKGTLNCGSYSITCASLIVSSGATINLGSATHIILSSGFNLGMSVNSSANVIAGTSTIKYTGTGSQSFSGGGKTYNNIWFNHGNGTGIITIIGSNTFNNFKDDGTVAHTIKFTDGTTQTISSLDINGSSGKLITLTGTSTAGWNIIDTSGSNDLTYCNISYSNASGGAKFNALTNNGCVDGGNNTGWKFIFYDFYLWSSATLPWQLALPWQFLNGLEIIGSVTNYLITGVNVVLSRLRNLLASVTAYTISGVNVNLIWETAKVLVAEVANYSITTVNSIFSWGRNLFTSNTSYSITTINALLYRLRCLITQTISYTITTFDSVISRPIRNLLASVSEYVIGSTGVGLYKGWGMLCESTSYLITGINSILSKALNLFTANTEYTITTIDAIIQRLVILITATTNYSITTVGSIFTKALNLFLSVTEYSIIGVNTTLSRLRNLITEKSEYIITGIDTDLLRPIRNFIVNTTAYIISTFSVSFRGTGDWLWRWVAKPSASDWSNGNKPTNTYNNVTKPSSDWTNKTKIE